MSTPTVFPARHAYLIGVQAYTDPGIRPLKTPVQHVQLMASALAAYGYQTKLSLDLVKINHNGKRADSIVKSMLQHARSSSSTKQPTDLDALTDEFLWLAYQGLRRSEGRTVGGAAKDKTGSPDCFNCELVTHFAADLPNIEVVPQEIGRVLLNLFNNAFYAVGQQVSSGERAKTYVPTVWVNTHQLINRVEIRVKDNGMGIPYRLKSKPFQPFFTTKPTGEGTGLGLSLSYDIVTKGHGGTLTVASEEGEGTEFVVSPPLL